MSGQTDLSRRLDARIRHALEPARFPERRDVELAFAVAGAPGEIVFFDHFWTGATGLWAVTAGLRRDGLGGSLAATGLRQLLRALAAELGEPGQVVSELGSAWGDGDLAALAVARLDTAGGAVRHAARGAGSCGGTDRLDPGAVFWLRAGAAPLPEDAGSAAEALQSLVDRHIGDSGGVLAALRFKAPAKTPGRTTLSVRNDRADVPDALAAMRAFLERHGAGEEDVSALELALDEILTNQINYGFRDGAAHEILLELGIEGGRLAVEIRDDGAPFDPLGVAPPDLDAGIEERQIGGLGMHFVRTLIDEVRYRREGGWNVLSLARTLSSAEGGQAR